MLIERGFTSKIWAIDAKGTYIGYEPVTGRTSGNVYHELNLVMEGDTTVTIQDYASGKLIEQPVSKGQRVVVNKPENFTTPVDFVVGDTMRFAWVDDGTGTNKLVIEHA